MSGIVNLGQQAPSSSQVTSFNPSFVAVTTSLAEILAADSNCYKVFIFNPSDSVGTVKFVFIDSGDTPVANQCLPLMPGTGWIEEGIFTSAGKAIHAIATTATSVLIWKWIK